MVALIRWGIPKVGPDKAGRDIHSALLEPMVVRALGGIPMAELDRVWRGNRLVPTAPMAVREGIPAVGLA